MPLGCCNVPQCAHLRSQSEHTLRHLLLKEKILATRDKLSRTLTELRGPSSVRGRSLPAGFLSDQALPGHRRYAKYCSIEIVETTQQLPAALVL